MMAAGARIRERADKVLVSRGLAPSRERAQALIMAGLVLCGNRTVIKPGEGLDEGADIVIKGKLPFVSRGGLKLAEALDRFGVTVEDKTAVDVGSSTGGFTDCLLQRGARRVYAVDVDTKQLDWRLRGDPRVVIIEKNARYLEAEDIPEAFDLVTIDVSFISILKIMPALKEIPGSWLLLALVKPQFEAGRAEVGKKGIVRDPAVHESVLRRIAAGARESGFGLRGVLRCSTRGQKGNVEFFGFWAKGGGEGTADSAAGWIKEAVSHENR
jgi:23S rRNA (cytidine1920-2'-O)/16S rRNA (cytidine1409-2'-O)-methyltransferase